MSEFTSRAWINAPPIAQLPSCLLFFFSSVCPWSLSLSLSPSISQTITVGQKSPHWRLQGRIMRINELEVNMQAMCCLRHYTSQSIGFHQKWRWIELPKAHSNVYLSKGQFKDCFKRFNMHIQSHLEHFIHALYPCYRSSEMVMIHWMYLCCCFTLRQINIMFFYHSGGKSIEPSEAVMVYWCVSPNALVTPPPSLL